MTEIEAKDWLKAISVTTEKGTCIEQRKEALFMGMQALEEVQQYRALGTVEELKELKDKNTPRKLDEHNFQDEVFHYLCPSCRNIVTHIQNYCEECGQRLGE